ncbi:unnamed protein product, partial [Penicillium salamii]
ALAYFNLRMKIVFLWHDSQKGSRPLKSPDKKLGLVSRTTMRTDATKAHELGSLDRHPLARLQRYYHTHETLEKNSTRRANQTPRVNLDRRR